MEKISGWSESGGTSVVIIGTAGSATQRFQQSFRGATITVYNTGTLDLVSLYDDDATSPASKANPFTANPTTGAWAFFIPNGRYDIRFSGGGISTPFTLSDVKAGTGNSGVTSYAYAALPASKTQNAGNLARVTDDIRGLWMDSGALWSKIYPMLNFKDFGAVGDGVTDNLAAYQAAVAAAIAGRMPLFVPRGTYLITYTSGNPKTNVTGDFVLIGAGMEESIIQFGPSPGTFTYYGLDVPSTVTGGLVLRISDITLTGPATAPAGGTDNLTVLSSGIHCKFNLATITQPMRWFLNNVRINGEWSGSCVDMQNSLTTTPGADIVVDMQGCDLYSMFIAVTVQCNTGQNTYVHMRNSILRRGGITSAENVALGGPAEDAGAGMYIQPNHSVNIDNCQFRRCPRYAVYQNGSPTAEPYYVIIRGCHFAADVIQGGILLSARTQTGIVDDCDFKNMDAANTAIVTRGGGIIRNCVFNGKGIAHDVGGLDDSTITITGCRFLNGGVPGIYIKGTNWIWRILNCDFSFTTFGTACAAIWHQHEATTTVFVEGCRFYLATNAIAGTVGILHSIGTSYIRDNWFSSASPANGGSWIAYNGAIVKSVLINNYFEGPSIDTLSAGSGTVTGWGNRFPSGFMSERNNWQNLTLTEGMHTAVLASAGNLTWPESADVAHVSGTTTINNIWVKGSNLGMAKFNGARLVIIADAAFTLASTGGGTGNLRMLGGANRLMAANDAVEFVIDSSSGTALLYEVK